jgi:hypothetical protein
MKPHKHAEVIKAWADGAEIQICQKNTNMAWVDIGNPNWVDWYEYRVKPAREFPKTSLSAEQVSEVYAKAFGGNIRADRFNQRKKAAILAVADAAIKQYILDQEAKASTEAGKA